MAPEVRTDGPIDVVDVTDPVESALPDDHDGPATVFVPHTTAGVIVNEAEPRLLEDVASFVDSLAPEADYRHDAIDDNAAAHLRASLLGESVTVPVDSGSLALGTWQSILFVECDGPRTRTVRVLAG